MTNPTNLAETVARESRKPQQLLVRGNHALFAVPDSQGGFKLETDVALDALQQAPERKRGLVSLDTVEAFTAYVLLHATAATTIWCKVDREKCTASFRAIFNDNGKADLDGAGIDGSTPGWRDFSATFTPARSVEWTIWAGMDRKPMDQAAFATFIDDNLKDIATVDDRPTATQMLEMSTNLEISQDKSIKSAVRVQSSGINVEYVENDDTETIKRMNVFARFVLGLAPFWRGAGYQMEARLKYKLSQQKLTLWYELVRPDLVLDAATESLIKQIQDAVGRPVFFGDARV